MKPKLTRRRALALGTVGLAIPAGLLAQDARAEGTARPVGWTAAKHGSDADPNHDRVFSRDRVGAMTITIAPDDWAMMQADLAETFASTLWLREGIIAAGGASLSGEALQAVTKQLMESRPKADPASSDPAARKPAPDRNPIWVPATISVEGREWKHVGLRHKGKSSLTGPWGIGSLKLPFKLDFDQFEDAFPEIKNQRFFGFKQLSLANNHEDPTGMRDTLVYELLAAAGLPSLRTAPYEIVLDHGEGPVPLGLYTMIEVVDDTGIPAHFGSDDGNIYEGDGFGASLSVRHADLIEESFQKKNNEKAADWGDIHALYAVLHDPVRLSDPAAWREALEAVFDVDVFLEWLGIAVSVGHWDTYGAYPHNFYLYNDPATGRLTWISWDHNVTFRHLFDMITFDRAEATEAAPLIRFLLDDPVYRERYLGRLAENARTVLAPQAVIDRVQARAAVNGGAADAEMGREAYDAAVAVIVEHVNSRAADRAAFLAGLR